MVAFAAFAISNCECRTYNPGLFLSKPRLPLHYIPKTHLRQRSTILSSKMISKDLNNNLSIGAGALAITLILINR